MQRIVQNTLTWRITFTVEHTGAALPGATAAVLGQVRAVLQEWQRQLNRLPVRGEWAARVEQAATAGQVHAVLVLRWSSCRPAGVESEYAVDRWPESWPVAPYSTDFGAEGNRAELRLIP